MEDHKLNTQSLDLLKEALTDYVGGWLTPKVLQHTVKDLIRDQAIAKEVIDDIEQGQRDRQMAANIKTATNCRAEFDKRLKNKMPNLTGFEHIDKHIGFFVPGEVMIIGARASSGKTNIGLHMAKNIRTSTGLPTVFVSLEMSGGSVYFRQAGIEICERTGRAHTSEDILRELEGNTNHASISKKWENVLIIDKTAMTLRDIEDHIAYLKRERGELGCVVVDYMGFIRDDNRGSLYEKMSRISRETKELAKRQNIRLILLCQATREAKDGRKPMEMHYMRDSGAIEESGDYLIGMWKGENSFNRIHCAILKNRNGEAGIRFDLIQEGVKYREEDYFDESTNREVL